jgi:phage nucleotide-binding protein
MNFETTPDKINRGISMIFYADPGVGKTTLASTLPEKETLIINSEAGLGPLLGTKHIVFNLLAAVKNYEIEAVVDELYKYLRTAKHGFKYIVIDNMSELEQQLILNITMRRGKDTPELREYGDVGFKMKEWVRCFRDLVYQGITVVFNAWEFPLEIKNFDGAIITKTFPLIGKKIAPQVCGVVDVVGHLEVHEKTGRRWVRFGPSEQYITKSQFKGLDSGEMPDLPLILGKLYAYDYSDEKLNDTKEVIVKELKGEKK